LAISEIGGSGGSEGSKNPSGSEDRRASIGIKLEKGWSANGGENVRGADVVSGSVPKRVEGGETDKGSGIDAKRRAEKGGDRAMLAAAGMFTGAEDA
jgi:hypothetical protein